MEWMWDSITFVLGAFTAAESVRAVRTMQILRVLERLKR